ncbi:hypothetical protein RSOLAG22IIIB_06656 [Rhizoctonia solani]|uniref:Uncharacterized protein n=1 Tax=Rhizoctonia solani TaxID=456999 RepID=A0A0K6GFE8_9AGAM|nr:hypothetical protein RSOLAG22IIIB_06656 [Rhizoctonia solani]
MATKTLNFYAYGLQKDTTVMLMFEPPNNHKLFKDQFPVVWKVITFRAKGHAKASIQYGARLAFGYAQTDQDNLVDSAAWVEVRVRAGSNVTAQFTPNLTAYVTRDYKATEMLRGEVETDAIWTRNLNELDDVTGWNFVEDDASGAFSIVPSTFV